MGMKEDIDKFIDSAGESDDLGDEIDGVIKRHIEALHEAGYSDDEAESLVFDALAWLIEKDIIPDTPDINAPENIKWAWIESFNNNLPTKLAEQGVGLE